MSFVDQADVLNAVNGLMEHLFRSVLGVEIGEVPRFTYDDVLARFGTDKPDLRAPQELVDLTERFRETGFRVFDAVVGEGGSVIGLRVPGAGDASRGQLDKWTEAAKAAGAKGLVWARRTADGWSSSVDKFVDVARWGSPGPGEAAGAQEGDLVLAVADRTRAAQLAMGALRLRLARERGWIDERAWRLLWVVDFPLYEELPGGGIAAAHHPFTSPVGGLAALSGPPLAIKAQAYDLVLNGYELGSGSIRIHERDVQEKVFELLGISKEDAAEKFGFLLQAFEYGAPPHGGFAIGFDRVAMLFAGGTSLREVIAFPKTTSATGLMEGAPSAVEPAEIETLHIRTIRPS
jgi:aspartyl-tRNA synthetase